MFRDHSRTTADNLDYNPKNRQSLASLVTGAVTQLMTLIKGEIESAKRELIGKVKTLGIGIGLLAAAGFFALTLWAVLVTAAILGLNTVFAPWLSALIVAAFFLIVTVVLALIGVAKLKKARSVAPTETIASIKDDVNAVKGVAQYE